MFLWQVCKQFKAALNNCGKDAQGTVERALWEKIQEWSQAFSTTQSDIGWGIKQLITTSIVQESAEKSIQECFRAFLNSLGPPTIFWQANPAYRYGIHQP